jgi:hypothetical protein
VVLVIEPNDLRKPVTWPSRHGIGKALARGMTGETSQGIERRRGPCLSMKSCQLIS